MKKTQTEISVPITQWVQTLVQVLTGINSPVLISFISNTPVEMNQYLDYWIVDENGKKRKNPNPTRNPYYDTGIRNVSRKFKINTGFDYQNSVNRRREKEGLSTDFKSKENWFDVISKGLVIDKKTMSKYYIRYQYVDDSTLETEYLFEGNPLDRMFFDQFISDRGDEYKNQEVDDPCRFQVCNLENLLTLSIDGKKFIKV